MFSLLSLSLLFFDRMSGPIFGCDPCPRTTSVVECFHLLPYKEVLLNIMNRYAWDLFQLIIHERGNIRMCHVTTVLVNDSRLLLTYCRPWPLDSSLSAPKEQLFQNGNPSSHSEIDESLKEQEANSKSKLKKINTNVSTPKKNKQVVKAVSDSGTNNCTTTKNKKKQQHKQQKKIRNIQGLTPYLPRAWRWREPHKRNWLTCCSRCGKFKICERKTRKSNKWRFYRLTSQYVYQSYITLIFTDPSLFHLLI